MKMENKGNEVIEWMQAIIIALIIALVFRFFIFEVILVEGSSMYPTLETGNRLIVSKLTYRFTQPKYGDIIVFKNPDNPKYNYIKRIIGVEGDRVAIKDGKVYINDKVLEEPYILDNTIGEYSEKTVPKGTFFVMGDNRNYSRDSRNSHVGFIPTENILGKAKIRIWPIWSITIFK
jgi:signal peptidase I